MNGGRRCGYVLIWTIVWDLGTRIHKQKDRNMNLFIKFKDHCNNITLNFVIDTFLEFIKLSYWIHLEFSLNNNRKISFIDFCFLSKAEWSDQMCLKKIIFSFSFSFFQPMIKKAHRNMKRAHRPWFIESMPWFHLVSPDLIKPTLFPLYFWQRIVFGDLAFCSFLASSQHLSKSSTSQQDISLASTEYLIPYDKLPKVIGWASMFAYPLLTGNLYYLMGSLILHLRHPRRNWTNSYNIRWRKIIPGYSFPLYHGLQLSLSQGFYLWQKMQLLCFQAGLKDWP